MCECSGGKPVRGMKVKSWEAPAAPWTDHDPLVKDLSASTSAGTRKMVNYACIG